jgi:hypothetical protein
MFISILKGLVLVCSGLALFGGGTDQTAASAVAAVQDPIPGWQYCGSRIGMDSALKAAEKLQQEGYLTRIEPGLSDRFYIYIRIYIRTPD